MQHELRKVVFVAREVAIRFLATDRTCGQPMASWADRVPFRENLGKGFVPSSPRQLQDIDILNGTTHITRPTTPNHLFFSRNSKTPIPIHHGHPRILVDLLPRQPLRQTTQTNPQTHPPPPLVHSLALTTTLESPRQCHLIQ